MSKSLRSLTDPAPQLFELLAGPIAWSLQLVLNYLLAEAACRGGWLSAGGVVAAILVVTGLAGLVTGYAGLRAYRHAQATGHEAEAQGRALQRSAFMARSGLYLSALFLFLILLSGLPALLIPPCGSR